MSSNLYSVIRAIERQWDKPKKRRKYKHKTKSRGKPTKKRGLSKSERFHRQKPKISRTILSKVDDKEIIYGARALNKRFPPFLDKHTTDFDIFSTHPKKDAKEAEKALDKAFGGDHFYVEKAQHPGTWKIKAHANKEGYADYTKPDKKYLLIESVGRSTLNYPM